MEPMRGLVTACCNTPCVTVCMYIQSEILREADAMASLDHPYIVRLYGKCRVATCYVGHI